MTGADLAKYLNKSIMLVDQRTQRSYTATIKNAKYEWGKLRLQVAEGTWFEPTAKELKNVY
jgi:hypothetical protein